MTSIEALYNNKDVPSGQRDYFWKEVESIIKGKKDPLTYAIEKVYVSYDDGGHSLGRSLRSVTFEQAIREIRRGDRYSAGEKIAILVAMYHNNAYIEKHGWYDYPLDFVYGSSFFERIHLAVIAICLGFAYNIPTLKEDGTILK